MWVGFGERSVDDMLQVWVNIVYLEDAEFQRLVDAEREARGGAIAVGLGRATRHNHCIFPSYVVSGFSRTTTVRLKADTTYKSPLCPVRFQRLAARLARGSGILEDGYLPAALSSARAPLRMFLMP